MPDHGVPSAGIKNFSYLLLTVFTRGSFPCMTNGLNTDHITKENRQKIPIAVMEKDWIIMIRIKKKVDYFSQEKDYRYLSPVSE